MTNQSESAPADLTFELFEPIVGEVFAVPIGEERFDLTLTEAGLLKHFNPEVHRRPPFELLFACPDLRVLPQGNYAMDNATLGALEVFIVPIAGDAQGITYQAVFN